MWSSPAVEALAPSLLESAWSGCRPAANQDKEDSQQLLPLPSYNIRVTLLHFVLIDGLPAFPLPQFQAIFEKSKLHAKSTMNISELKDDLAELYHNRSSYWVRDIPFFMNARSKILWKLGPIFTERETYGDDDIYETYMTETCGTCVATQVEPNPVVQGIAKIRMQIPDDPGNPSSTKPKRGSRRVGFDFYNHDTLTKLGCTCIPKLLDYALLVQEKKDPLPGGFLFFLVMERLPGRNLVNFADLPMSERDQVRLAFAKSIREFYAFRFMHNDPNRRNLVWDPENKKCYIIDLEDAYQINDDEDPTKFMPELHYREWGIAGPETNCHMYGLDPMVPHDGKCIVDPDDEMLEKMAADAAGKELVFGK